MRTPQDSERADAEKPKRLQFGLRSHGLDAVVDGQQMAFSGLAIHEVRVVVPAQQVERAAGLLADYLDGSEEEA